MNAINMPAFTAEASLYKSSAHYQVGQMPAGLQQGGEALMHRAVTPQAFIVNSMKGFCADFGSFGGRRICCNYSSGKCVFKEIEDL
jgi:hypothetical protein